MAESAPIQVDVELVRALAELLDEGRLTEIEVEDGARRVRVARQPSPPTAAPPASALPSAPAPTAVPPSPAPLSEPAPDPALRSPMVGTAYLTPEPGAPPFAREGDDVREGQTLLIIEAMKVMNPIAAPRAGRLLKILVAHEQPVEFDQPLLVIG